MVGVERISFSDTEVNLTNQLKAKENIGFLGSNTRTWNAYHVFRHLQSWLHTYIIERWTHWYFLIRLLVNTVMYPFTWERAQWPLVHNFICCWRNILWHLCIKEGKNVLISFERFMIRRMDWLTIINGYKIVLI